MPPERPKEMLANPFLKRRNPIADKELGGKVDLLLGVADSGRCHRGPRHYTDDRSGYVASTVFRWVLGGQLPGAPSNQTVMTIQPNQQGVG